MYIVRGFAWNVKLYISVGINNLQVVEVGQGFEPWCPLGLTPFQGGRIGRSRTLPFVYMEFSMSLASR